MKYSYEDRLRAVHRVLQDHMSAKASAAQLGCHKKDVQLWVAHYEQSGEEGLRLKHGSYSGDFKLSVITHMLENHLSLFETTVKFGISSDSTVRKWHHIFVTEGPAGLYRDNRGKMKRKPNKPRLKPQREDLFAENERLRTENAYLKKLQALVEERIARESGRRSKPSND